MERPVHIPALTQHDARQLVFETCDVVFFLDRSFKILEIICTGDHIAGVEDWVTLDFSETVASDSISKVDVLLSSPAWTEGSVGPWRHLNLVLPDKSILPLLLKLASFHSEEQCRMPVLLGRDLRSTARAVSHFQAALSASQSKIEKLSHEVESLGRSPVVGQVGRKSLHEIVDGAIFEIRHFCIKEAMQRTNGDIYAAARLLGVPVAEIREFLQ